jgi:hypothetical protein
MSHGCGFPLVGSQEAAWPVLLQGGLRKPWVHVHPQIPGQSSGNMAAGGRDFHPPQGQVEKNTGLAVQLLGLPIWETVLGCCTHKCDYSKWPTG